MKTMLNFRDFNIIKESERKLESFLDSIYESSVNENVIKAVASGSPFKYGKLKKAAAEYQKALVQVSINNLDFEKKKVAGTLDPKQKDVLAAANKQKNQALRDKATAVSKQMDDIATTQALKNISSIAKNKAQIAAAEIAAKTADGEEAKALKLRIQGLNKKIKDSQEELEDYKDSAEDNDDQNDQNLDNVKTDSGETVGDKKAKEEKERADAEKKKAEEQKAAKIEAADKKIETARANYEDDSDISKDASKEERIVIKMSKLLKLNQLELAKAELEENKEKIESFTQDIKKIKKIISDAKKKKDDETEPTRESFKYVNESVAADLINRVKFNLGRS